MQISGHYGFKGTHAADHFHGAAVMRWGQESAVGFSSRLDAGECTVRVCWVTADLAAASAVVRWIAEYFDEVGGCATYPQFDLDAVDN